MNHSKTCGACCGINRLTMMPEWRPVLESHHAIADAKDAEIERMKVAQTARDKAAEECLHIETARADHMQGVLADTIVERQRFKARGEAVEAQLTTLRLTLGAMVKEYEQRAEISDPSIVRIDELQEFAKRLRELAPATKG